MSGIIQNVRLAIRRVVDPVAAVVIPGFSFWRHRRTWNGLARTQARAVTAPFEPEDDESYWASGRRDLGLILELGRSGRPLGNRLAVEIGCGTGRLLKPLTQEFEEVVGSDISNEMLGQAQRNVRTPNTRFTLVGSDCRLNLADASTDLVIAWTVFRHTPKAVFGAYIKEVHRILRPGGRFVFEAQIRQDEDIHELPDYLPVAEREYRRPELEELCRRAQFAWLADKSMPSATPGTYTPITAWER